MSDITILKSPLISLFAKFFNTEEPPSPPPQKPNRRDFPTNPKSKIIVSEFKLDEEERPSPDPEINKLNF